LAGGPDGWRLGLALLEHRGVAAWARAWHTTAPAADAPPARLAVEPPVESLAGAAGEIVGVLASMALACLAGR
jgi:hypothetical protein